MAWNQPGGDDKDPWNGRNHQQGPPDLGDVIKNLQMKFAALLGGGKGDETDSFGSGGKKRNDLLLFIGLLVLIFLWVIFSGLYLVNPGEKGVELLFGRAVDSTDEGLHWHWPYPIMSHTIVNVDAIVTFPRRSKMLTRDENVVVVDLEMQYKIRDPQEFLFYNANPREIIKSATESALREVIGTNTFDDITTANRSVIAADVRQSVRNMIEKYQTGLEVVKLNIQKAEAPKEVKDAFDDVVKAREDKVRYINEAEAYANEVIPKARGVAARMIENAKAYKAQVIAEAEGESQRFLSLYKEYEKAPQVTRQRLFLETIEKVYAKSSKVMLDAAQNNNLTYLPLDRMLNTPLGRSDKPDQTSTTGRNPQTTSRQSTDSQRNTRPILRSERGGR